MELNPSWKATSLQPVKKFSAFYATRSFISVFTTSHHEYPEPMNAVHTFPSYFSKIHLNVILPSTPGSHIWPLPFRFSDQNFVSISQLCHARYIPHLCRSLWFDQANHIWLKVQSMKLLIMQFRLASSYILPLPSHIFIILF